MFFLIQDLREYRAIVGILLIKKLDIVQFEEVLEEIQLKAMNIFRIYGIYAQKLFWV